MTETNPELELYRHITTEGYECGWVSDSSFYIWLYHFQIADFVKNIVRIFGDYMFDEGGAEINLMKDCVCIDLSSLLSAEDIDFEQAFPKKDFQH